MKVGIVTTWHERCGLAAYSENIVRCLPGIEWRVICREGWGPAFSNVPLVARECDLVHIMHQGGLMASMSPEIVRDCGKTVITRQCSGPEEVFDAADVKTCHVRRPGYRWVPHGIHVVGVCREKAPGSPSIGCCGIPFDGKGHYELIQIAEMVGGVGVNMVVPDSPHTASVSMHYKKLCGQRGIPSTIFCGWPSEQGVSGILSRNDVNVFYYTRPANGTSGAVRMGLAARRPVIVSNHSQFADIIETGYVTVASSLEDAAQTIRRYLDNEIDLEHPDPLLDMWSYEKTAQMYADIYKEVLGDSSLA